MEEAVIFPQGRSLPFLHQKRLIWGKPRTVKYNNLAIYWFKKKNRKIEIISHSSPGVVWRTQCVLWQEFLIDLMHTVSVLHKRLQRNWLVHGIKKEIALHTANCLKDRGIKRIKLSLLVGVYLKLHFLCRGKLLFLKKQRCLWSAVVCAMDSL